MILKPWQVKQMALGLPATPCNRSSSNSSQTAATTNNTDRRVVNDRGLSTSGDGNMVNATMITNTLDGGAISAAFDFSKTSSENAYKSTAEALGFAGGALESAIDIGKKGMTLSADQQRINAEGLLSGMGKLLDFARDTSLTARQVNESATKNVAEAYSNVQEIATGQKFLVAGALAIAGVVAVSKMKG
ncbi:hypothetical protein [Cupriavidus campinensis]|uniref:hypothetical protein n=1 Tax=Cupriavidus campinensis TaxID=151783 RepID=UPI0024E22440|nr:hypothetical protein [Cupriavidus campinensis]